MQKQMSSKLVKTYPISDQDLQTMQSSFPELYNDMVRKYGEHAVKNNFLVKFQILTEGAEFNSVNKDGSRGKLIATKAILSAIVKASKLKWYHYFANFMSGDYALKSKYNRYPSDAVGYIPLIGNHDDKARVQDKFGWVVSSSLNLEQVNDKWVITGDAVLVNPIAKFNHLNDNWFEVSPTIRHGILDELSYVIHNQQPENTSFSRDDNISLENTNLSNTNLEKCGNIALSDLDLMHNQYMQQQEDYRQKLNIYNQDATIAYLKDKQIICDGQVEQLKGVFSFERNSPHELVKQVAEIVNNGTNPYMNKPKLLKIEGNNMNKTYNEHYAELAAQNPQITDPAELHALVEQAQANQFSGKFNRNTGEAADVEANLKLAISEAQAAGVDIAKLVGSFSTVEAQTPPAEQPAPPPADDIVTAYKLAVDDLKTQNAELTQKLDGLTKLQSQVNAIKGVN